MALSANRKEELIREFVEIVHDIEEKISVDREFSKTNRFAYYDRRMMQIIHLVEGCSCSGRGNHLASLVEFLKRGQKNLLPTYGPMIFKKEWDHYKENKQIKVL